MEDDGKKPVNKKLWIGAAILLLVALLIFTSIAVPRMNKNKKIEQADSLIAMGKFEEGIDIYEQMINEEYSDEIMNKRYAAIELMESEENLKKGIEAYEDGELNKAIKFLSKVSESDRERYKKAEEALEDIEEDAIIEIDELINKGSLEEAEKVADTYAKAWPKNKNIKNAKERIIAKGTEVKKQEEIQEQEKITQEQERIAQEQARISADKKREEEKATAAKKEEKSKSSKEETQKTADSIMGTYKAIVSKQANLREAPTLDSKIVATLKRGTMVYIGDTQVESADRIWCLVYVDDEASSGWVSYNTMNYSLQ